MSRIYEADRWIIICLLSNYCLPLSVEAGYYKCCQSRWLRQLGFHPDHLVKLGGYDGDTCRD